VNLQTGLDSQPIRSLAGSGKGELETLKLDRKGEKGMERVVGIGKGRLVVLDGLVLEGCGGESGGISAVLVC
jgi:hypothetical protein